MDNRFETVSENDVQQQENAMDPMEIYWMEISWEEIFDGIPTSPGTEAAQERHKQLREQDTMTEEEDTELNELFFLIYLQCISNAYKETLHGEPVVDALEPHAVKEGDLILRQLLVLLLWSIWLGVTLVHCGVTLHGVIGCLIAWVCCGIVNMMVLQEPSEGHF